MTELDAALVRRKVARIARNLEDLEAVEDVSLAERLAPAAGLRNRLVHEYDELDDEKVLEAVATARRDLGGYVAAVEGHLESGGV